MEFNEKPGRFTLYWNADKGIPAVCPFRNGYCVITCPMVREIYLSDPDTTYYCSIASVGKYDDNILARLKLKERL